jgi:hypothetical protein
MKFSFAILKTPAIRQGLLKKYPTTAHVVYHWLRQCKIIGISKHWQSQWHTTQSSQASCSTGR